MGREVNWQEQGLRSRRAREKLEDDLEVFRWSRHQGPMRRKRDGAQDNHRAKNKMRTRWSPRRDSNQLRGDYFKAGNPDHLCVHVLTPLVWLSLSLSSLQPAPFLREQPPLPVSHQLPPEAASHGAAQREPPQGSFGEPRQPFLPS